MRLVTCPGILLRSHAYSESSQVLRFLTPDLGVVSLLARGIRRRSGSGGGSPETFAEGVVTFHHRSDRDLHTLRDFEQSGGSLALGRELGRFYGASLLAELILAHTLEDESEALYSQLRNALRGMDSVPTPALPGWILASGWGILALLGFSPELDECVRCGAPIGRAGAEGSPGEEGSPGDGDLPRFDPAGGGMRCLECAREGSLPRVGPVARSHLQRLVEGAAPEPLPGARIHLRIMEAFALHHLAPSRGFRSFELLEAGLGDDALPPGSGGGSSGDESR